MLPILTGNVGIHGGNGGARDLLTPLPLNVCRSRRGILLKPPSPALAGPGRHCARPREAALRDGVRGKDKLGVFRSNFYGTTLATP